MKAFGLSLLISAVSVSGSLYYGHVCRESVFVANFQKDLADKENRIFRDEVAELRSRPNYKNGVSDTILSMVFKDGYKDGVLAAYETVDPSNDYVSQYHRIMSSISANMNVQEEQNKKKVLDAYHQGIADATESKLNGLSDHPDYTPKDSFRAETTDD